MPDTANVLEVIHNRESWLNSFAREIAPLIRERAGLSVSGYKVSCGFPAKGAMKTKNRRIGECWHMSDHKWREIFIHPQIGDSFEAGAVLIHELLHAALAPGVGHRKPFSQAAKKVGLLDAENSKPTATVVERNSDLGKRIQEIVERIGEYPHDALPVGWNIPTDKGRQLKVACPECGYVARTTQKWLDEAGAPVCPTCDVQMEEAAPGPHQEDDDLLLTAAEQIIEYQVPPLPDLKARLAALKINIAADPRWSIRMARKGKKVKWTIIDYGYTIDPATGRAVYGVGQPRITPAESRQDAKDLLVALRDGTMTYADLEVDDDDPGLLDAEWFDDSDDEDRLHDHLDDSEVEDPDYPEDQALTLFPWEQQRGIRPEDIDPLAEQAKRESWVKA